MKKILILLVLFIGLINVTFAQDTKVETVNGPKMSLAADVVDYGTIERGADPLRTVDFTNTGTEPLVIKNARGSCGCTVPTWPKEPVMPGETATIEIRYDTKRVGNISKTVKVTTNEKDDNVHVIRVKGKILRAKKVENLPTKESNMLAPKGK